MDPRNQHFSELLFRKYTKFRKKTENSGDPRRIRLSGDPRDAHMRNSRKFIKTIPKGQPHAYSTPKGCWLVAEHKCFLITGWAPVNASLWLVKGLRQYQQAKIVAAPVSSSLLLRPGGVMEPCLTVKLLLLYGTQACADDGNWSKL